MARAVEVRSIWSRWGQPLLPIGVVYDPFVNRALGPWSFGIYAGGQSILVGTPSGVTLAPEGGAHQSVTTPSLGIEQPGCVTYEPAFVIDTEWCLLAALGALPGDPAARERRRRHVTAGAYRLRQHEKPVVTLAAMGALVPEALAAADRLTALGHDADVVCVTSPDLLFRALQARRGLSQDPTWILDQVFPADRATPLVTVLDGHPHTLAFLGHPAAGAAQQRSEDLVRVRPHERRSRVLQGVEPGGGDTGGEGGPVVGRVERIRVASAVPQVDRDRDGGGIEGPTRHGQHGLACVPRGALYESLRQRTTVGVPESGISVHVPVAVPAGTRHHLEQCLRPGSVAQHPLGGPYVVRRTAHQHVDLWFECAREHGMGQFVRPRDQGRTDHRPGRGAGEREGCAHRIADGHQAVQPAGQSELADVAGPVPQRPPGRRVGHTQAWPVDGHETNAGPCHGLAAHSQPSAGR